MAPRRPPSRGRLCSPLPDGRRLVGRVRDLVCAQAVPDRVVQTTDLASVCIELALQVREHDVPAGVRGLGAGGRHDLARLLRIVDPHARHQQVVVERLPAADLLEERRVERLQEAVSYTHLTLPTIYSV